MATKRLDVPRCDCGNGRTPEIRMKIEYPEGAARSVPAPVSEVRILKRQGFSHASLCQSGSFQTKKAALLVVVFLSSFN